MGTNYYHLKAGSFLQNGNYRIEKVLGRGGFGITYLAYDVTLDKHVAIKEFFPKGLCSRDEITDNIHAGQETSREQIDLYKAKFLKEARQLARLEHPNIVRIFAAFEENDTAYYVMEYIEGRSLMEIVKTDGPMSTGKAVEITEEIGSALEYIHKKRINHLDVKPSNIMMREKDGRPILIDFGLSKQYDSNGEQTSSTPLGISHGYAPLEQYRPGGMKEFSAQSDIYSLAATLYYLVSVTVPGDATEVFDKGLEFGPNFPKELIAPIRRAMSPMKKERHETMAEFLKDLRATGPERPRFPKPDGSDDTVYNFSERDNSDDTVYDSAKQVKTSHVVRKRMAETETPQAEKKGRGPKLYVFLGIMCLAALIVGAYLIIKDITKLPGEETKLEGTVMEHEGLATENYEMTAPPTDEVKAEEGTKEEILSPKAEEKTEDPATEETSAYGPFRSKDEVVAHLNLYLQSTSNSIKSSLIAPTIKTDFGTPQKFNRNEFIESSQERQKSILRSSHKVVKESVNTTPLKNGGVEVSFEHIYEMVTDKDGKSYSRVYVCRTVYKINKDRQIYDIYERSDKLSEGYL